MRRQRSKETIMEKKLEINGMTCHNCVRHATEALKAVPGVKSVAIDLAAGTATVETSGETEDESLKEAVRKAGYKVVKVF